MASKHIIDWQARAKLAGLLQNVLDGSISASDLVEAYEPGWTSRDMVTHGILDELRSLDGKLQRDDCGLWNQCNDHCSSCRKCDPKSPSVESSNAKHEITRAIEFLSTDLEYRWDEGLRIPWWMVLPAVVVLVFGIIVSCALAFPVSGFCAGHGIGLDEFSCMLINCIVLACVWLGLCSWLVNKVLGKDKRYWPFYGLSEWKTFHRG